MSEQFIVKMHGIECSPQDEQNTTPLSTSNDTPVIDSKGNLIPTIPNN